jgi:hypothetical protein
MRTDVVFIVSEIRTSMIENTEKVDTCQLEIQKCGTPVEGPLSNYARGADYLLVFRFEIPGSRSLLLPISSGR